MPTELLLVSTGMVSIPPVNGGAVEAYVADLARMFAHRPDYHVSVISNHRGTPSVQGPGAPRWVATHSPIDAFPLTPGPSALAHLIGGTISAGVAVRHFRRLPTPRNVVIHLNEEISGIAFSRLGRPAARVFTVHNPPPSTGMVPYGGAEYVLRNVNARLTWRFALRRMDAVIALTRWIGRYLVEDWQLPAERVHILPLPVDTDEFAPAPESERPTSDGPWKLLFVGRLEARKNLLVAVEALRWLPERAHLVVVGHGPLGAVAERRAAELGLSARLTVLPRLPPDGLKELYRSSTVLLHPSLLEAYPRVVVEAAACGLPSVVPESGMYHEFLAGGCSSGYRPEDGAPGLAESVQRLAGDPSMLRAARGAARAYALRENAFPVVGDRLAGIYRGLSP